MEKIQALYNQSLDLLGNNRWLQALAVVVVFTLVAKLTEWIIARSIAVWARRSKTNLDDRLIELSRRPVFVSMILFGVWLAVSRLELASTYSVLSLRLLKTLALLIWLRFVLQASAALLDAAAALEGKIPLIEPRTLALLKNVTKIMLFGGGVYLLCLSWGINVGGWLVTGGVLGLVLGLAAQDTLSNLFAGIFILADAPYKVGDFINLDSGERGQVTDIGLRSTRLLTRDDIEVTVPNSVIANAKIINETGGPWQKERVRVKVGVAYGSDIDRVREILMDIAIHQELPAGEPEPQVRFRAFGESSLDFELLVWIDQPVLRGRTLDALYSEVYKRFNAEGIEIPYPKRDVYLHQVKEKPGEG